jgi:hypothetical protein
MASLDAVLCNGCGVLDPFDFEIPIIRRLPPIIDEERPETGTGECKAPGLEGGKDAGVVREAIGVDLRADGGRGGEEMRSSSHDKSTGAIWENPAMAAVVGESFVLMAGGLKTCLPNLVDSAVPVGPAGVSGILRGPRDRSGPGG